ncbi:hypothetical protein Trydic_g1289 [Trypoxylus dichotomus]
MLRVNTCDRMGLQFIRTDQGTMTGTAFVIYAGDEEINAERLKLDQLCNNFQAELVAINPAVECDKEMQIEWATLFVLRALKSMRKSTQLLLEIWKLLREVNVELRWMPVRVGTEGNDKAYELAKEGAVGEDDGAPLAYTFASEKTVKSAIAIEIQSCMARELGVALSHQGTQLVTEHANFEAYLDKIMNIRPDRYWSAAYIYGRGGRGRKRPRLRRAFAGYGTRQKLVIPERQDGGHSLAEHLKNSIDCGDY